MVQKYSGKYGESQMASQWEQFLDKFKTCQILSQIKKYFVTINMLYVLPAVKHNLTFVRSQSIYARFMVMGVFINVTLGFGEFVVV